MGVEQVLTEGFAINAVWNPNGSEGGKSTFLRNMHGKPLTLKTTPETLSIATVARPGLVQTFLRQQTQGLTHAEIHIHRRRVVVNTITAPVLIQ